jgi:uncharacterized pyridoxal phosphate-containing UPF0001 family protein
MTTSQASSASPLFSRVAENYLDLQRRIELTGRSLSDVRIVGVTKTFGQDVVRVARQVGITCVGENYVEELEQKRKECADVDISWNYLGALQTNKIARIAANADVICGVSRIKEIEKIAGVKEAASIYVQVDFTGAEGRNGASEVEVEELVTRARALDLDVRGLMCVAAPGNDAARLSFSKLVLLADSLGLKERSMGMTDDLEIACELGSTEVRIGRALFGPR